MHQACREFMDSVKKDFPSYFKNSIVLDVGSQDINGTNKHLFENCTYVGIDLGPGKNVDFVSHVADFESLGNFKTIVSTNAFEHDARIKESLEAICFHHLLPGGLFVFSCATEGTPEHGTTEHYPGHSPHTNDFYKNVTEQDIRNMIDVDSIFSMYSFQIHGVDLRFIGIKRND